MQQVRPHILSLRTNLAPFAVRIHPPLMLTCRHHSDNMYLRCRVWIPQFLPIFRIHNLILLCQSMQDTNLEGYCQSLPYPYRFCNETRPGQIAPFRTAFSVNISRSEIPMSPVHYTSALLTSSVSSLWGSCWVLGTVGCSEETVERNILELCNDITHQKTRTHVQ